MKTHRNRASLTRSCQYTKKFKKYETVITLEREKKRMKTIQRQNFKNGHFKKLLVEKPKKKHQEVFCTEQKLNFSRKRYKNVTKQNQI